MCPPFDLKDVAINLTAKLAAPLGAVSVSSFRCKSGETILVLHISPKFSHLSAQIPREWMGVKIEYDIAEYPTMN